MAGSTPLHGDRVRAGQALARSYGVHIGRPRDSTRDAEIERCLALQWGVSRIARELHVSRVKVRRVRARMAVP